MNESYKKDLAQMTEEEQAYAQIEGEIQDMGIGHYEFWGTDYYDKNEQMVLTTEEIMIQYDHSYECIPIQIRGTLEEGCLECDWIAILSSIKQDGPSWIAYYEVQEE